MTTKELSDRITQYLSVGGLFNPEMMEHEKVRDLLMDCRDFLNRASQTEKPRDVYRYEFSHRIIKNGEVFAWGSTEEDAKVITDELNRLAGGSK